jgi:hypothetical protein
MNRDPEWEKTLELLRRAHQEPLDEANYAAMRARVLERLRARPRRLWWPVWAAASLAAAGLATWLWVISVGQVGQAIRLPRAGQRPAPPIAEVLPIPEISPVVSKPKAKRARRAKKAPTPSAAEPLLVKLITDDPDVVIYWIADPKGD